MSHNVSYVSQTLSSKQKDKNKLSLGSDDWVFWDFHQGEENQQV